MTGAVNNVLSAMNEALNRASGTLLVRDADFGDTLRIGQIIKGRVLRHYDGGRYLVQFGEQQKVVDSSVPLRTTEMFDSRVVALGDRVHLQRLHSAAEAATEMARTATTAVGGRAEQTLVGLFERFNATLPGADLKIAAQAVRRSANPELMAHSALLLNKLGLPASPELLQALYARLTVASPRPDAALAPRLAATPGNQGVTSSATAVEQLAAVLTASFVERTDGTPAADRPQGEAAQAEGRDASTSAGGDFGQQRERPRDWELGQWLLGVQSHPRVAHRLLTLPIWFGEQLVEVSVALYSEHESPGPDATLNYRRVVFFVSTEQLGKVQITVHAADRRLRLDIAADSDSATQTLAAHMDELLASLDILGWQVDDVRYLEADVDVDGAVLGSVVHHHISQDSLSRLM